MSTTYTAKKRFWNKKKAVVAGIAATFLIPAAAWAAVTFFGFGDFAANAAATPTLTIDNTALTKTLVPGASAGAKGIVHNPNDFPIKVSQVIIKDSSVAASGSGCDGASLTLLGTSSAYPTNDGGGTGHAVGLVESANSTTAVASVDVPANGAAWIYTKPVVSQNASATALCGVNARFAVEAATNAS